MSNLEINYKIRQRFVLHSEMGVGRLWKNEENGYERYYILAQVNYDPALPGECLYSFISLEGNRFNSPRPITELPFERFTLLTRPQVVLFQ